MLKYKSFSMFEQVSIDGLFKKKHFTPQVLFTEQNLYTVSYSWLDSTNEPAAGSDMYCYNYDNMRMLSVWCNANHPAVDLDHYDNDHFFEDVVRRNFRDGAFKLRKN